jgi:uncharacterized protein HemX
VSADDRPDLHAAPGEDTPPIASEDSPELQNPELPRQKPREKRGGRGWLTVLLILALVAACLGYFYEEQRAQEFETRAIALQTELQEARQDLRAHEERMQVVRGHVDDLAGRIGLLQQAITADAE